MIVILSPVFGPRLTSKKRMQQCRLMQEIFEVLRLFLQKSLKTFEQNF